MAKGMFSSKKKIVIFSICCVCLIAAAAAAFVLQSQLNNKKDASANKSPATIPLDEGPQITDPVATSTTSAPEATTARAAAESPTDTIKPSSTIPSSSSTTAPRKFKATASASLVDEDINHCVSAKYTFDADITANKGGTVNWEWIRWDNEPTGLSGTMTFSSNGSTLETVDSLVLSMNPSYDVNGWVALKITWSGGSHTSDNATFFYDYTC